MRMSSEGRLAQIGDNDRKDGREGNDMQSEVAGRPQHMRYEQLLAQLQGSEMRQSPIILNRATIKTGRKSHSHRHTSRNESHKSVL